MSFHMNILLRHSQTIWYTYIRGVFHTPVKWAGNTVYPKKYAHGFCFAVLCCGYTLTDFPISIRLTSLALWQSNDCPSASKATLMNMDKYFIWIHYERLHNHNKAKHNKTVCIFLGIYCILVTTTRKMAMMASWHGHTFQITSLLCREFSTAVNSITIRRKKFPKLLIVTHTIYYIHII